jgi:hypothetical protein
MTHTQILPNLHPFVSELVRRQRARYEMPLGFSNRKSQPGYEEFMQREPALTLRWISAFSEDGRGYLRMEYNRA